MTQITVFRNKFVRGWPRHDDGERGYVLELGAALERTYSTDAHFTAYASPNKRRLTSELLDGANVVLMTSLVFDLDCPAVHGTGQPAPESWRRDNRLRVLEASEVHGNTYGYDSKGGLRFLWRLPQTVPLRTPNDAQRWTQDYAICCAYLERRFGLDVDPACSDWQRFYRLPHATRDQAAGPENRGIWGDPDQIGTFHVQATTADMRRASELTKAFRQRRIRKFEPYAGDGRGVFFHLLIASGSIDRERHDGAFVIQCPNEAEHSTGRTADGSTLLYPPAAGEQLGAIHCLHGHCSRHTARDWLRFFSETEIQRAREAAGVAPKEQAA